VAPLHAAVKAGHTACAAALLRAGADVNATDGKARHSAEHRMRTETCAVAA
jgi:hypothetical protein